MGGQHDGGGGAPVERGPESGTRARIHRLRGLVEEKNRRIADQRSDKAELLDHARRTLAHGPDHDVADVELFLKPPNRVSRVSFVPTAKSRVEEQVDVPCEAEVERSLERERDADTPTRRKGACGETLHEDPPTRRLEGARDTPQNSAFARAVWAPEGDPFPGRERKIEGPNRLEASKAPTQPDDLHRWLGRPGHLRLIVRHQSRKPRRHRHRPVRRPGSRATRPTPRATRRTSHPW